MGAFEELKGKVKGKVGDVTDNPDLESEGAAQQDKGEAERHETQARTSAQAHEKKAEELGRQQQAAQEG